MTCMFSLIKNIYLKSILMVLSCLQVYSIKDRKSKCVVDHFFCILEHKVLSTKHLQDWVVCGIQSKHLSAHCPTCDNQASLSKAAEPLLSRDLFHTTGHPLHSSPRALPEAFWLQPNANPFNGQASSSLLSFRGLSLHNRPPAYPNPPAGTGLAIYWETAAPIGTEHRPSTFSPYISY